MSKKTYLNHNNRIDLLKYICLCAGITLFLFLVIYMVANNKNERADSDCIQEGYNENELIKDGSACNKEKDASNSLDGTTDDKAYDSKENFKEISVESYEENFKDDSAADYPKYLTKEDLNKLYKNNIRVLITTGNYESVFHENITISADTDFHCSYEKNDKVVIKKYDSGEKWQLKNGEYPTGTIISLETENNDGDWTISSVQHGKDKVKYIGKFDILQEEEGLVLINELSLEEYLCSVICSEMPSSYPYEALKAQAVAARTYAFRNLVLPAYPQYNANLDDSTMFQVYNNISRNSKTDQVVYETKGMILIDFNNLPYETYYYSTSCGNTKDQLNLSEDKYFSEYIGNVNEEDFEKNESFYRWSYQNQKLDVSKMYYILCMQNNNDYYRVKKFAEVYDIYVNRRGNDGVAEELCILTDCGKYTIYGEYYIREILKNSSDKITKQDGKEFTLGKLLPSAYFVMMLVKEDGIVTGFDLIGGGFGHGKGMSQNGAKNMAENSYDAVEILKYYYKDAIVFSLSSEENE